ncbi:polycomb group protein Psc-like [Leptidea sinapis]|uniref:polycomb group protein Psc-like n=1 Tax=Leptidea sinapis TaxID=189913 RepID=UPI002133343D|nr:polycomb group protein Psc-like [Leptidea sinapis]
MVTSNQQPDKKVAKMTAQSNSAVVPHRTLLGEVNEHITCPLCHGYYIDAITIVECLHSFCRSCIIKHLQEKKYCPVCEMMINAAKPNIKLDKALQDIVYKLVPGLFQREMERRQQFYSSRPGPAASATPEQRGEDTERIIFSPEDVISFSLEYSDVTDTDSISSKSSDSNEAQSTPTTNRRYLQCPAVVNISHLKKFLSMKFDIESSQFAIDILYKRVPLPDYYTLMDIAYIYNWKRNEPMRFFYQIIDYVAIRNRLFDNNRKSSTPLEKKPISVTEQPHSNSPVPHCNDQSSETSSGTDSPLLDEIRCKKNNVEVKNNELLSINEDSDPVSPNSRSDSPTKKVEDEVKKSQFLNSFELTAKNATSKTSPSKIPLINENFTSPDKTATTSGNSKPIKVDEPLKRKPQTVPNVSEVKKVKVEPDKVKVPVSQSPTSTSGSKSDSESNISVVSAKPPEDILQTKSQASTNSVVPTQIQKELKPQTAIKQQPNNSGQKRHLTENPTTLVSKRKQSDLTPSQSNPIPKTVSPLKLLLSKTDMPVIPVTKTVESPKVSTKKLPDLRPSVSGSTSSQKGNNAGKVRMDLLANNSDPTIDRSKILSQVKTSLSNPPPTGPNTGDNLKSLFDSCKINIPSSLSITLTDQKSPSDLGNTDQKKNLINKNLNNVNNTSNKVPCPPVHNYIEIKKIPDLDSKKAAKSEGNVDPKTNKVDNNITQTKAPSKGNEGSAKGPVPNLKPIADTKLGKQSGNFSSPITFQQTFEQQLHSLQSDTKSKLPKNKSQVPKLVPATPKSLSTANKFNNPHVKITPSGPPSEKSTTALDLSTPHSVQNQLGQTKAFETMQSIVNLANKQNLQSKIPIVISQSNVFPSTSSRPVLSSSPLRIPNSNIHMKQEKINPPVSQINSMKQDVPKHINPIRSSSQVLNTSVGNPSPNLQSSPQTPGMSTQPSPRSLRSPSSSPKLVIAEEKQTINTSSEQNQGSPVVNNTPHSTLKSDSPKETPTLLKPNLKTLKPLIPPSKLSGIRQPITPTHHLAPTMASQSDYLKPVEYLSQPQLISAHHALLRHQMEIQSAWLKAQRFDYIKNMPNMAQGSNDFGEKDKQ